VGEYEVENLPRLQLVAKMLGKDFDELSEIKRENSTVMDKDSNILVDAKGLGCSGIIKPFDLKINSGDILGISGLLGSGRSELARTIYGAYKPDKGSLQISGNKLNVRAPIDAMKAGMAFLPEDRKEEGVISDLSVRENIIIALQSKRGIFRLLSKKEQEELTDRFIEILNIKAADREVPVKQLSGGNQQKVIIARWLLTNPDFFILDEPTRGIDVGTKSEIQRMIVDLAEQGKAVIFISSEVEEMLRICNRMVIMRDTSKVGELKDDEITQENIMKSIAGGTAV